MFAQMENACKDVSSVSWLRADLSRRGEMPDYGDLEAFGRETAKRVKARLLELKVGREGGVESGVFWY
ncbi:hypothetical protein BDW02DRAFT_565625 [Decorospora gaudefroyi]|uniref:Uncharacterized protein n=1 Tax=Decorospora gaudefroyi TaxID=184978 RepID=A0A6A5KLA6_9PLEO|nr:hypothetical protein BDW02DRAFT_565625 [Decorospora gaudefroyi]